jgi:hypothetical protein
MEPLRLCSWRGGDTGDDCMLDLASKGCSRIIHNAQSGSSLHRLALHGRAAIDAAAAWAFVSHSALCPVVRGDSLGHTARIAERSTARDGGRAQQSACAPGDEIRAGRLTDGDIGKSKPPRSRVLVPCRSHGVLLWSCSAKGCKVAPLRHWVTLEICTPSRHTAHCPDQSVVRTPMAPS